MAKFKRILLKLSGESLMGSQSYGIDPERLSVKDRPDYLTSTTKYLLVLQNICGLVMRKTYCLLAS